MSSEPEQRLRKARIGSGKLLRSFSEEQPPPCIHHLHHSQEQPPPCDHAACESSCVANAIGNLCQTFLLSYGVRVGIGILLRAFKLARSQATCLRERLDSEGRSMPDWFALKVEKERDTIKRVKTKRWNIA